MNANTIRYSESRDLPFESVLALYRANEWSLAQKAVQVQSVKDVKGER